MQKLVNPFLVLLLGFIVNGSSVWAISPDAQAALDSYISQKKSETKGARNQMQNAKHDVDELETRLLPAVLALNRTQPFVMKRLADLTTLEKYLEGLKDKPINPYLDRDWANLNRMQAMAVCCAIRSTPKLMREVQDNLVSGLPPLSDASLRAIAEAAAKAQVNSPGKSRGESDEIVPSRPFESRSKSRRSREDVPEGRRGLISGLPDLQPPAPKPAPAPIPAPTTPTTPKPNPAPAPAPAATPPPGSI